MCFPIDDTRTPWTRTRVFKIVTPWPVQPGLSQHWPRLQRRTNHSRPHRVVRRERIEKLWRS